jgi:hypothetical protein
MNCPKRFQVSKHQHCNRSKRDLDQHPNNHELPKVNSHLLDHSKHGSKLLEPSEIQNHPCPDKENCNCKQEVKSEVVFSYFFECIDNECFSKTDAYNVFMFPQLIF